MAASNEPGDLIDLNNGVCVSRGTRSSSQFIGDLDQEQEQDQDQEREQEEQEHLLDVCPPKLEQKLSLTSEKGNRKKREISSEIVDRNSIAPGDEENLSSGYQDEDHEDRDLADDDGDVLVTLGHDKVVPIVKRIDVVSSDTIKRVKDITKNLEPVISLVIRNEPIFGNRENDNREVGNYDSVDAAGSSAIVHSDDGENLSTETFETREINDAFHFLAELEDCEEDEEEDFDFINQSGSSDGPLMREIYSIENQEAGDEFSKIAPVHFSSMEFDDSPPFLGPKGISSSANFQTRPASLINSSRNPRLKFFRSYSLRAKNIRDRNCEDQTQRIALENGKLRRSLQVKFDRKSWSEGVIARAKGTSPNHRPSNQMESDRSNRVMAIDCEKPSTSNGSVGTELDYEDSTDSTLSSSSSSASEVDWSWVDEVESSRAKSLFREENEHQHQRNRVFSAKSESEEAEEEEEEVDEEAIVQDLDVDDVEVVGDGQIPTTNTVNNSNITKRMRQPCNTVSNSSDSIVMSAGGVPTAKSFPVPGCPGPPDQLINQNLSTGNNVIINNSNNNSNNNHNGRSWVRASMRRLRHLRLPETAEELREREIPIASPSSSSPPSASSSNYHHHHHHNHIHENPVIIRDRNSLPDIALIAPEILAAHTNAGSSSVHSVNHRDGDSNNISNNNNNNVNGNLRPASAPGSTNRAFGSTPATSPGRGRLTAGRSRGRNNRESSRRSSFQSRTTAASDTSCSSTNSSVNSTATSPASSNSGTPQHPASGRRVCERQRGAEREDERGEDDDEEENPLGRWPHALSPALACLGCTLGLFNISRFAILSIQFGANFIVQFLILSLILGIPLFTLQVCLGQRLAAGAVDMWRISPLFQGVGIALLTAQAFIGIYSIVGISWMFVYFRDSFITKQDKYRWAEPFNSYRDDNKPMHNGTSYKLQETVPDYFSGVVLQRHHLNEPDTGIVTLKFQVAFNLAVVWMIVFVSLSKGLRSYGKVVYVFTLVPVFGTLVLCAKLLGLTPSGSIQQLFPTTVWSEFFTNGKSWMAASTEVFLTWGLFGAAAMQIAAHNKHKHLLQRDTSLVVVLTFVVLLLSAFLANTCVQILKHHGYIYTTSSFESISGYTFMHLVNQPVHSSQSSIYPERAMNHASFLAGQRVSTPTADLSSESGYQVLRLATELVPATLAMLGSEQVSPFWAILFYFILILFGIAQQLAIWHCVITGIMAINTKMMKLWETTITFFSCACGYILGLPMATEFGIYVVYYLDYTVGGAWWIMVLYLVEVGAVFAVRGRPHTGEAVVAELFPPTGRCLRHWAGPLLSFTWNVVLPVALMVLSIMIFKSSGFRDLYTYRRTVRDYWPIWARQLGAAIQLIPILTIPVVAIIQTCRYLNSGPPDIFDVRVRRIQLLYRPSLEPDDVTDPQTQIGNDTTTSIHGNGILPSTTDVPFEDPPPKYTPPPSYTTATGARIAKMLRQSFRRSVRRIANVLGESSTPRQRPALQPPPPDYATVLVEMNQGIPSRDISIIVTEAGPDVTDVISGRDINVERQRPNTIDRTMRISTIDRSIAERSHSTMDRSRRAHTNNGSSNLTAADVANLLRSSIRRGTSRNQQSLNRNFMSSGEPTAAISIENLVEAAAPIGQDSLVLPKGDEESLVFERDGNDDKKTVDRTDNATTVI